jgi:DNA-binding NarL/FixJ family response regulator
MTAVSGENNRRENGSGARGEPAVGVIASPARVSRAMVAALELDDLVALVPARGRSYTFDAVVIAVETPTSGEAAIRDARAAHGSAARITVVADAATPAEARKLLVDDVPGLVLVGKAGEQLARTVRATLSGQVCYPAELMPTQLRAALSSREKQILGMVVMGFSNAEIAAKLHISASTVKSHLHSSFATIGVRSRKEAVALILDPDAGFGAGILAITPSSPVRD